MNLNKNVLLLFILQLGLKLKKKEIDRLFKKKN